MRVIKVRNVHLALPKGLALLQEHGIQRGSRNGPVSVISEPVTTVYTYPQERVLFWDWRDWPPFFAFFESLWMMAGRNDLTFMKQFVKRFETYSDDQQTLHGAYGYRWRSHFYYLAGHEWLPEQLDIIIDRLTKFPEDRRSILQMWDPRVDLGSDSKDLPCNVTAHFQRNAEGALDMTVFCRSNDIIWGAYLANAVHFSVLQEYMATAIGCKVGRYWQISDNYHAYNEVAHPMIMKMNEQGDPSPYQFNPYLRNDINPYPLVSIEPKAWLEELDLFLNNPGAENDYSDRFFTRVARPLWLAHEGHKHRDYVTAKRMAEQCWATDWRKASVEWLQRREAAYNKAREDGPDYGTGK